MTIRSYLTYLATGSLLAWIAWLQVLLRIDPAATGNIGITIFFLTLFVAIMGTLAFFFTIMRYFTMKQISMHDLLLTSLRQAAVLSIMIMLTLFLASTDSLSIWSFLLVIVGIGILEYIFLSKFGQNDSVDSTH